MPSLGHSLPRRRAPDRGCRLALISDRGSAIAARLAACIAPSTRSTPGRVSPMLVPPRSSARRSAAREMGEPRHLYAVAAQMIPHSRSITRVRGLRLTRQLCVIVSLSDVGHLARTSPEDGLRCAGHQRGARAPGVTRSSKCGSSNPGLAGSPSGPRRAGLSPRTFNSVATREGMLFREGHYLLRDDVR